MLIRFTNLLTVVAQLGWQFFLDDAVFLNLGVDHRCIEILALQKFNLHSVSLLQKLVSVAYLLGGNVNRVSEVQLYLYLFAIPLNDAPVKFDLRVFTPSL